MPILRSSLFSAKYGSLMSQSVFVFSKWRIFRQQTDLAIKVAMSKQLVIDAKWDSGARVWVAMSEDVPGVAFEVDSTSETMVCDL